MSTPGYGIHIAGIWLPWLLLGALVAWLAADYFRPPPGPDPVLLAQEAVLRRDLATAQAETRAARDRALALEESAAVARRYADSVATASRREGERARQRAIRAGQAETEHLARVRATLEAAGLPTADVDSVEVADAQEDQAALDQVAAVRAELVAVRGELDQTRWAWDAEQTYRQAETTRADVAEGLAATREALWRAAEEEAARLRRGTKLWRAVAIVEGGALAWTLVGGLAAR